MKRPNAPSVPPGTIIRLAGNEAEAVKLNWGLRPKEREGRPLTVIRSEDRAFPDHRCLIVASDFRHKRDGKTYRFTLADGDWFYLAGIWRAAMPDWPESFAALTIDANEDVKPIHDRMMTVLRRNQNLEWLRHEVIEPDILRPLPAGTFKVERVFSDEDQPGLGL